MEQFCIQKSKNESEVKSGGWWWFCCFPSIQKDWESRR